MDPCYLIDKIDTGVEYQLVPDSLVAQSQSYQARPMGGFVVYHRKTPITNLGKNHAISLSLTFFFNLNKQPALDLGITRMTIGSGLSSCWRETPRGSENLLI